jgi:hypothetical protein
MFYERVASTKFSLYFIELLEYGKRRVMACGACGELYATDELGPAEVSAPEKVMSAAEKAGAQIGAAAKDAFGKIRSRIDEFRSEELPPTPERRPEATDDPLADDENALEAKFRDLEKRYRVK